MEQELDSTQRSEEPVSSEETAARSDVCTVLGIMECTQNKGCQNLAYLNQHVVGSARTMRRAWADMINPHTSISSPKPIESWLNARLRMLGAASRLYNGRWSANLGKVAGSDRGVPHDECGFLSKRI